MLLRHAIGAALRRIRLANGLTLRALSQRSRVSIPYLSEIERGRKEPSSEILATVCGVFGLTVVDLVEEVAAEFRAAGGGESRVDAVIVDLSARHDIGSAAGQHSADRTAGRARVHLSVAA